MRPELDVKPVAGHASVAFGIPRMMSPPRSFSNSHCCFVPSRILSAMSRVQTAKSRDLPPRP
eukprot:3992142-Pyramimonas_sp.AAC.1